jgi:predicted SprT family Zn-dependent metalloprotease
MDLGEAEVLAKELINKYTPEYGFGWMNEKRTFGRCYYNEKMIRLSRVLTPLCTKENVRKTIMHEIAHALWPLAGHRGMWRVQMRRFGYEPERCNSEDIDRSSIANWAATCPGCGKIHYMYRKPRQTKGCAKCGKGKYVQAFELTFRRI